MIMGNIHERTILISSIFYPDPFILDCRIRIRPYQITAKNHRKNIKLQKLNFLPQISYIKVL